MFCQDLIILKKSNIKLRPEEVIWSYVMIVKTIKDTKKMIISKY